MYITVKYECPRYKPSKLLAHTLNFQFLSGTMFILLSAVFLDLTITPGLIKKRKKKSKEMVFTPMLKD